MTSEEYDTISAAFKKVGNTADEPNWVIARSVEEAQAFAAWCVENGFEEPRVELINLGAGKALL